MDLGLRGKTVLVTGSTAGIGFAAARAFAREGARVVVNGRSKERVEEARGRICGDEPNAEVVPVAADLGTRSGVDALLNAVPSVDVLVNNLGIFEPKPFLE